MSDYLVQQIRATPQIDVRLGAEVVGAEGEDRMVRLSIRDHASQAVESIPCQLLFVLIGAVPHTDWLADQLQRDARGFIVTGPDVDPARWPLLRPPMSFETSVPGVFAAGDVRHGSTKRMASAVGEAAGAVPQVHEYLAEAQREPLVQSRRVMPAPARVEVGAR